MVNLNGIIWNVVSTCIDYWQPEVKGPGLCSGGWGGSAGWDRPEEGGLGGRVSKVLQVTVQVKRQILSAVWRKALEVPTVQRERSSLSGTQVRARSKRNLLSEATGWLLCSIRERTQANVSKEEHPPEWADKQRNTQRMEKELGTY